HIPRSFVCEAAHCIPTCGRIRSASERTASYRNHPLTSPVSEHLSRADCNAAHHREQCARAQTTSLAIRRGVHSKDAELFRGHSCSFYTGSYLLKRRFTSRGGIVAEWRKTAIIGCSQALQRDVLRGLEHAIAHLVRSFNVRINWICDADVNQLIRPGVFTDDAQHAAWIRLARELDVKPPSIEAKKIWQQVGVVHVGTVGGVLVTTWAGVHTNPLSLVG